MLEARQEGPLPHEHQLEPPSGHFHPVDPDPVNVPQLLGAGDGPSPSIPVERQGFGRGKGLFGPALFKVDVVLHPVDPVGQGEAVLPVPGVEDLPLAPLPGLLHGIVEPLQGIVLGQELQVVPKLVGDGFPELLLPVEVVPPFRHLPEGAPVEGEDGPGRVGPHVPRGVGLREAHPQGVVVRVIGVDLGLLLHHDPVDPLLVGVGDLGPHLVGPGLEDGQVHRRVRSPPPGPGSGSRGSG